MSPLHVHISEPMHAPSTVHIRKPMLSHAFHPHKLLGLETARSVGQVSWHTVRELLAAPGGAQLPRDNFGDQ